jgi:hypothetical protein
MTIEQVKMPPGYDDIEELVNDGGTVPDPQPLDDTLKDSPLEVLRMMSATKRLEEMKKILNESTYIFPDMAISGMTTLFFSPPNGGKTLMAIRFLIDAIKEQRISGEDVFYINADDNYSGLLEKAEIAEKWGFNMISPAQNNLGPSEVLKLLMSILENGEAEGKVFIFDTLKKFADMMSKKSQAELYEILRKLNSANATNILLGHTNKHLGDNDELIYEGTSDTLNDVDVAYAMYTTVDPINGQKVIAFRNIKDRGRVIEEVAYRYSKNRDASYVELLESVESLDKTAVKAVKEALEVEALEMKFESVIHFVKTVLADGPLNESQIIRRFESKDIETSEEFTKSSLRRGLEALTGHAWEMSRSPGQKNAKVYCLKGQSADEYRAAKNGDE